MRKIDFSSFDNHLVELYSKNITENEDESFSLGYILKDLDSFIVFMSISETGTFDSIQLRSKRNISKIVKDTEYTKMYDFFVSYSKNNKVFDDFSLENIVSVEDNKSIEDVLNNTLKLKRTVSIVTSKDESVLTGKIALLDTNQLVLTLLNYESMKMENKKSVSLDSVICIDVVSVENFLYDKYLEVKSL